jgi:signal peptidase I
MAALAAMLIFRVARVEGQAMAPAINHQDRLLVNRLAFRDRPPRRLDIVMMLYPRNPEKKFVMRIIAEPGDLVEIKGGWVYLNGEPYDDTFVAPESRSRDDWGPRVVPQGHYFVLGDRRNNSSDSRHWGFVPRSHILGRVDARWFPQARRF